MKLLNNDNYVDLAEKAIKSLDNEKNDRGRPIRVVTTSQIRNLLAMTEKFPICVSAVYMRLAVMNPLKPLYKTVRFWKFYRQLLPRKIIFCLITIWNH